MRKNKNENKNENKNGKKNKITLIRKTCYASP